MIFYSGKWVVSSFELNYNFQLFFIEQALLYSTKQTNEKILINWNQHLHKLKLRVSQPWEFSVSVILNLTIYSRNPSANHKIQVRGSPDMMIKGSASTAENLVWFLVATIEALWKTSVNPSDLESIDKLGFL